MKKLIYLIMLVLILGLVLTGCLLSNVGQVPTTEQSGITYLTKHTAGAPYVTDLLAGQTLKVGEVKVWNDTDNLYVKYFITDLNWCLTETHLHVATSLDDIPHTNKGNPIPGQFEYKGEHECETEVLYEIPLTCELRTDLVIAAHAVVWDKNSETTMTIVSGINTGVTAVNGVPDVKNAVKSIEPGVGVSYPNCPTGDNDAIQSLWDEYAKLSGGTSPDWMDADWIWSTNYPVNPVNGEYVDFSAPFEVSGLPVGGTLTITADNAYSASLNGVPVGSSISLGPGFPSTLKENVGTGPQGGNWGVASQGWQLVEEWPLTGLTSGNNELTIRAANEYMYTDDNYKGWDYSAQGYTGSITQDPDGSDRCINPAGLIFKASVDYYAHSETAWGKGIRFVDKGNWGMYFGYTVQCTTLPDLLNGDFESPVLTETWDTFTSVAGWIIANVDPEETDEAQLELQKNTIGWNPHSGVQYAELDSYHPTSISQCIDTCPCESYTITFWYSPRPGVAINHLKVFLDNSETAIWDSGVKDGSTLSQTEWTKGMFVVLENSGLICLKFCEVGPDDSYGMFLDDISISLGTP